MCVRERQEDEKTFCQVLLASLGGCFARDGANMVIVAANSGRSSHPGWFYNLKATPTVRVQVRDRILQVSAEELSTEEATAFWPRVLHVAPTYARYQQATSRTIPLVRLVPAESAGKLTKTRDEALSGREELSFTQ
jgi:deazaflavin-dependent oxidoreductase (nitroreductase family)